MNRRSLILTFLLVTALAMPLSASQFVQLPFDTVARETGVVVRGTLGPVTSAWDDQHQVIFSYAPITVSRYFAGQGPEVLMVREIGGTVGDYTQEAIGFPALREGQEVVLLLSKWEDGADWRIHAYNQGKFRIGFQQGTEVLSPDPVTQGSERAAGGGPRRAEANAAESADGPTLTIDEFAAMVSAARAERPDHGPRQQ
jgi:hypothetical protein